MYFSWIICVSGNTQEAISEFFHLQLKEISFMESLSLLLPESPDYVKERLAKSDLFNWIKDSSSGTHEKNTIYIVRSWLKWV